MSYKLSKVIDFVQIMIAPKLELSIFIKKALPNFIKQYNSLNDRKMKKDMTLTCSFSSKSDFWKQAFDGKL